MWARSETISRPSTSIPASASSSISVNNACGSMTTPLPMTHFRPGRRDSRRNQVEDMLLAIDDDRMASVVATLIAGHDVEVLGKPVDDLAFAFIPPLGA